MDLCTGVIVDQYSDALTLQKVLKTVADDLVGRSHLLFFNKDHNMHAFQVAKAGALEKGQVYQVIRPLSDPHVIFCIQRIALLQNFQIADRRGRASSPTIEEFFSFKVKDYCKDQ